jgi:hypothetical protein
MKITPKPVEEQSNIITAFQDCIDTFMDGIDVSDVWDDKAHDKFQRNVVEKCNDMVEDFVKESTFAYRSMRAALAVAEKLKKCCTKKQFTGIQTVRDTVDYVMEDMFPTEDFVGKWIHDIGDVDGPWAGFPVL